VMIMSLIGHFNSTPIALWGRNIPYIRLIRETSSLFLFVCKQEPTTAISKTVISKTVDNRMWQFKLVP